MKDFKDSWQSTGVTSATLYGAVVGMLVLGALADRLGRRRLMLISGALVFAGSVGCAAAFSFGPNHQGLWPSLIFWRFVLGVGVGGEYPLSAAHASESVNSAGSGTRLCLVFTFMNIGAVLSALTVWLCRLAGMPGEVVWRFAFAFGGLLSVLTFALRYVCAFDSAKFKEQQSAERAAKEPAAIVAVDAQQPPPGPPRLPLRAVLRAYWCPILGTAGLWFLYDVVNYGLGLYSSRLVKPMEHELGGGHTGNAAGVLILNLFALPGGALAAALLPRLRRLRLLQVGSLAMFACFILLSTLPSRITPSAVALILVALQSLFGRAGPGAMSYVMPAEIYPVRVRATCHGISAAAGKIGGAVGTSAFGVLLENCGLQATCGLCAGLCFVMAAHAQLFLPDYDMATLRRLEASEDEDTALRQLYAVGPDAGLFPRLKALGRAVGVGGEHDTRQM